MKFAMHRAAAAFVLAILVIVGFVLMFLDRRGLGPQPGPVTGPTAEREERVEVEHVLVTAEELETAAAPAVKDMRPAGKPQLLRSNTPTVFRSAVNTNKPATLSEKTRRAILGDGRHKPQPFPRINN